MKIFLGVVAALFVVAGLWVWNIAAGVSQRTLNPDNIIAQYEQFFDRCAAIQRHEASIASQTAMLETAESSQERTHIRANLGGLQAIRAQDIARYNADAAKMNVALFQDRDLPRRLHPEQRTVCAP